MIYKVSTTGAVPEIVLHDLGARTLTHPTVDLDLGLEYTDDELYDSDDLAAAISNGWITLVEKSGGAVTEEEVQQITQTTVSGLTTDHGELIGLSDDDHPQYHNDVRGDARYYTQSQVDTISGSLSSLIAVQTALATVQVERDTDFTVDTTWSDVTFETTAYENQPDIIEHDTVNTERILIKADGTYSINYGAVVQANTTTTSTYARLYKNGNTVVPASDSEIRTYQNERHELAGQVTRDLLAGDYITFQLQRSADGTVTVVTCDMNIIKLDGVKGAPGDQGPPGADGQDGVLTISGSADYFNGYDAAGTTQLGTSYTDIPLTEGYTTSAFSHSGAEVIINAENTYLIVGRFTVSQPSTSTRSEAQMRIVVDTGSGYTEVPGTIGVCYSRNSAQGKTTATAHAVLDLNVGDKIKLQAQENSGGDLFGEQNGSGLMLFTTAGQTGPQGLQGPAGQDGADGIDGVDGEDGIDAGGTLAVVQARRTTELNPIPLTWTDLSFDTTDVEYDDTIIEHDDTNRDRILIKRDGYYWLGVHMSIDDEVNARIRINDTDVIPGSERQSGDTTDANQIIAMMADVVVAQLSAGDFLTVQVQATTDAEFIMAGATFIVNEMVGAKGADGADGAPGTPGSGSTVNIYDEGSSVANTPHSILNFKGSTVSVTDAGGGQADITINASSGVTIRDEGTNLTSTPHSIINFTGTGIAATNVAGVATVTVNTPTVTFGRHYTTATAEGETNTNSTTPIAKVTLNTGTITAGDYRIGWYYEWRRNTVSNDYQANIVVDSTTTIMEHRQESQDVNSWNVAAGHRRLTLTAGTHTIVLNHYGDSSGSTSYTRRARLEIWRVT